MKRTRLPSTATLAAFECAARHLNFRRAADELHLTQGAVSQQVRLLEAQLGVALFARVRQRVLLTSAGERYLREVRRILRNRARYEVANNSYAKGIVLTLANDTIGTGPRLQMLTDDADANARIEDAFEQWSRAVDLPGKLRTMRLARAESGEAFALLINNPGIASAGSPVSLDLKLTAWKHAWQTLHPEWDVVTFTLETRPPILNLDQWQQTLDLSEPAASAARLNLLRYEVLAREGGVFVDPDRLPLRPLDELVAGVGAFCSTIASHGASRPHMLSPSVLGATRNHPMLWHAIRDLPHSVLVYRGVWDQSGPGFLTRVVRDHGHFRDVVPFHWALFEQGEEAAKDHGGAFGFVTGKTVEVAA